MGQFVKIGTTAELEDLEVGKLVDVAGTRIAIFNLGGKYYAIEDTCPHGVDLCQRVCWQRMRLSARGTVPDSK